MLAALVAAALAAAATAASPCQTWYDTTKHGPGFRNVKTYGAVGDGVTDDSNAIFAALTSGRDPSFKTTDPTTVYFPPGTYKIGSTGHLPLPIYFYTFVMGSWCDPPTIIVPDGLGYTGWVFDSDVGDEGGGHTNEFYRGFSNINMVIGNGNNGATGIHWAQSQATHVRNVTFTLGAGVQTAMFMENGSGGWISDVSVTGGATGLSLGNQQWTMRNIVVRGSLQNCIFFYWNWVWTIVGLQLYDCPTGIYAQGTSFGSVLLLDSSMTNVTVGVLTDYPNDPISRGILLERFTATNVDTIANGFAGNKDGVVTVPTWVQGPVYNAGSFVSGKQTSLPLSRPDAPLPMRPRLWNPPNTAAGAVVNVLDYGAVGNGVADDTKALQAAIAAQPAGGAVFLPQGAYMVSSTIKLRTDSYLIGEALSEIRPNPAAPAWQDATNPQPVIALPPGGSPMLAEIIFVTTGNVPGAVMLDWQSSAGTTLWDVHWRTMDTTWAMAYIHGATAGGMLENSWAWVADHDINTNAQITVLNPRGVLVEGVNGPLYLYGSASEHSQMFQYNFTASSSVYQLIAQTETPYNQFPAVAPGSVWSHCKDMHLYGGAYWNWNCQFFDNKVGCNQTALFQWESSQGYAFALNTHGADTVVGGDFSIAANVAPTMNWFTSIAMAISPPSQQ